MMWPLTLEPQTFVVGVERLDDGVLKVYVGHRYKNIYTLIHDEAAAREVERAWENGMQHVLIPSPPSDCLYRDEPAALAPPADKHENAPDCVPQESKPE